MRHDSQPRRRSLRVQYRCTGSMMTTRASESGRAIRHTDRRAAARHRNARSFSDLCCALRLRHGHAGRGTTRAYGEQEEATAAAWEHQTRREYAESKTRTQRHGRRVRGLTLRRIRRGYSGMGSQDKARLHAQQEEATGTWAQKDWHTLARLQLQ